MGQLLFIFLLVFSITIGRGWGAVWEFGEDQKGSEVIATANGDIQIYEKNTRVPFTVPACFKTVYVKVQVDNDITTPEVNFNKDTNTVIIQYKLLQLSWSRYYVVAKGVKQKNCGQKKKKRKHKKRRRYSSEESDEYNDKHKKRQRQLKADNNHFSAPQLKEIGAPLLYGSYGALYSCLTC